ncbi:hypothetical protein MTO96_009576 [Rhipicephalus appendiculatus]
MEATSTTTGKFEVTQVTTPDSLAGQNSTPLSPSIGDQDSDPSTVRLIPESCGKGAACGRNLGGSVLVRLGNRECAIVPSDRKKSGDVPGRLKGPRVCGRLVKVAAGSPLPPTVESGPNGPARIDRGGPIDARTLPLSSRYGAELPSSLVVRPRSSCAAASPYRPPPTKACSRARTRASTKDETPRGAPASPGCTALGFFRGPGFIPPGQIGRGRAACVKNAATACKPCPR